ncbi:MAG: hypothetical protein V4850_06295 [Myxococcota bacterium]
MRFFYVLFLALGACGSEPDLLKICDLDGVAVGDGDSVPWGGTAGESVGLAVGSAEIAWSADLPSGPWSSAGALSVTRSGDARLFEAAGDLGCPHEAWLEVPITVTLSSADSALDTEVSATANIWGGSEADVKIVAQLPFLEFGAPFASIVEDAATAAEAEDCVIGGPFDTVLLTGTLGAGDFGLDIGWTCDGGNSSRSPDEWWAVEYVAL